MTEDNIILGKEALNKAKTAYYDIGTIIDVKFTKKILQNGEANYLVLKIQLDDGRVVTEQMKISYTMRSKFYQFNEGLVKCGIDNVTLSELVGMKFKFERVRNVFTRNGIEQTVFFRKPVEYLGKEAIPVRSANYNTQINSQQYNYNQMQNMSVQNAPAQVMPVHNMQAPVQHAQVQTAQISQGQNSAALADKIYAIVKNEPTFIAEIAKKINIDENTVRAIVTSDPRFKILNDVIYT